MKKLMLLFTMIMGLQSLTNAQTMTKIVPTGIYKDIDVARHNTAIAILNGEDKKLKQKTVDGILKNPNYYNPPVIYALAKELFEQGKKDEGAYWFYIAQLRGKYDANLSLDNAAMNAAGALNGEYGGQINEYALKDINQLEKTVTRSVDFVRANKENYDHRWINLYGMKPAADSTESKTEKKEFSVPKEKWPAIKKETVDEYYNAFVAYVKQKRG